MVSGRDIETRLMMIDERARVALDERENVDTQLAYARAAVDDVRELLALIRTTPVGIGSQAFADRLREMLIEELAVKAPSLGVERIRSAPAALHSLVCSMTADALVVDIRLMLGTKR